MEKTIKTTANMSNFEHSVHIVSAYATELYEDIKYSFKIQSEDKFEKIHNPLDSATEVNFGHGRIERRTAYVDSNEKILNWCKTSKQFTNVKAFALVVKQCE
jgi:hypothetical protein